MPRGERYRWGQRHKVGAAKYLGRDTTWKMADHPGFSHEARNQKYVRNCDRYTPTASQLCQRFIHDATIVSGQCRQNVGCRHIGFEINALPLVPLRLFASDDADVGIGKKPLSPNAFRHFGERGKDQVDVATVEPVERIALIKRQKSD